MTYWVRILLFANIIVFFVQLTMPGLTELTRMLYWPNSRASDVISPVTPCLDAA